MDAIFEPLLLNMNDETLMHYINYKLKERESVYRLSNIAVNGININVDELADLIIKNDWHYKA